VVDLPGVRLASGSTKAPQLTCPQQDAELDQDGTALIMAEAMKYIKRTFHFALSLGNQLSTSLKWSDPVNSCKSVGSCFFVFHG
jgi:hypothetical protein